MSFFSSRCVTFPCFVLITAITGCTVEPLNPKLSAVNQSNSNIATNRLSNIEILPVTERVAQQVRNHLIFGINGGGAAQEAVYTVSLGVTSSHANLVVLQQTKSPTSAQVTVTASYLLKDVAEGTIIAQGSRVTIASYDLTSQSFANQRAKRDAENRAAREVAELLKTAIAVSVPESNG